MALGRHGTHIKPSKKHDALAPGTKPVPFTVTSVPPVIYHASTHASSTHTPTQWTQRARHVRVSVEDAALGDMA